MEFNEPTTTTTSTIPKSWTLQSRNIKEPHGKEIYCVAWSDDVFVDETENTSDSSSHLAINAHSHKNHHRKKSTNAARQQAENGKYYTLATCGSNLVTIYEVSDQPASSLRCIQSYVDLDDDESFNTCVFAGRSYGSSNLDENVPPQQQQLPSRVAGPKRQRQDSNEPNMDSTAFILSNITNADRRQGPLMVCAAGYRGVIKIIDPVRQALSVNICGHGGEIYDLKRSPTDEWMILSSSADQSIRLWNLRTVSCVAMFTGNEGHLSGVLCVSWHESGTKFASSGLDNVIKLWTLEHPVIQDKLHQSESLQVRRWDDQNASACLQPTIQQSPYFSSSKLHNDYVDCIQFLGDLLLSKSTTNTIILWIPTSSMQDNNLGRASSSESDDSASEDENEGPSSDENSKNDFVVFRTFRLSDCEVWYMKFGTNLDNRLLAMGNSKGKIKIWDIDSDVNAKPIVSLTVPTQSAVRMVSFSPNQRSIVACCDDSTVWKWDAAGTTTSWSNQR
jgi:polycomb protein EED